jgi:hypothetical protein
MSQAVAVLTCMKEVSGSCLGLDTGCDRGFVWLPHSLQMDDMTVTQIRIEPQPQPSTSFPSSLVTDYMEYCMVCPADSIINWTLYLPCTVHTHARADTHTHTNRA